MTKEDDALLFKARVALFGLVDGIIGGGGNRTGLGKDLTKTMSMTDATECVWGTSGRGNPNAKKRIRLASDLGYLKVTRTGRTERVGLTETGIKLWEDPELVRHCKEPT